MNQLSSTQLLDTSPKGVYRALFRCLKRTKGFGIVFVQCSPAEGNELICRVQEDLSDKKIAVLEFTEPIDNLYDIVANRDDRNDINILFIKGLEKSLEPYIKPGYGGDGDYYNLDTVPPILSHLNQRREIFRDRLSNICFVFILPLFAIKYIMRRAPDFFDWGSGVFKLSTDSLIEFNIPNQSDVVFPGDNVIIINGGLAYILGVAYSAFVHSSVMGSDLDSTFIRHNFAVVSWIKQGNVLLGVSRYEEAIKKYEKAIKIQPNLYQAWNFRGIALLQLGRYEESIASFDKALEIKPNYRYAKTNREIALKELN